ncbi:short-chain dehydrogenase [Streptomyces spiralis]|uniref:Short-chain dehydrogenase n=1 Tax=Streptomyces spiralis TaxID=66376 RepID=A0A919AN97_9ACTN|nr:SDR family oxidoreductase [Streptomyces spiralis]GHF15237.1 short-chain dehydrogenase [Streptomyces spiralis]
MPSLSGKTALVTGGNSGIGRAAALHLAALGAKVVLSGRDTTRGEKAVNEITEAGGAGTFVAEDLSDESSARRLARASLELGEGHVDILVNNAGIFPFGPTDAATEADFDSVYAVNVKVPFFLVAELAPRMAERGDGAIINVTTPLAEFGVPHLALYGSSKAALVLLTKSWAAEYGPRGVRVNAVSPGPTRTEGTAILGDALDAAAAQAPAGRPGTPEEIAQAVAYLATASWVHGAILPVDGGRTAV